MSSPAIEFVRVTKSYRGGGTVLENLDLSVADGELVTIVGPSGCGKSTLLSLVAGFEQPSSGEVKLFGEVVNHRSPRERGLAMVFQSYALYPHLDVFENIAFPLRIAGVNKKEIEGRVTSTAERLGLAALLRRKPSELSGGQRQRVALGRALVRRPRICLFDEPLSNLDAALRYEMRTEIKKLHEELGATFLYVTHDQAEAMTLSDRIVVLARGAIEQMGAPLDIYERPKTRFVASFLGSPSIQFVPPKALGLDEPEERVVIGVRPEDVTISAGEEGALSGEVYVVEHLGPETWVTVTVAGHRLIGRATPGFARKSGERVGVRVRAERLHRFHAKTGERVA